MVPLELIEFASQLADAARRETLTRGGGAIPVENKGATGNFDPVTEADRGAELSMRALIKESYPDHGISGEEFPDKLGKSSYCWSLDPIDGTGSYICGLPSWTTLIALLKKRQPVLGIIDAPRLDERYFGDGKRSWCVAAGATTPLLCSGCTELDQARLSTTDPFLFEPDGAKAFRRLRAEVRTTRYGHDAYGYARLAAGAIDLVVECGLKPHDYDALIPVVRGARGVFGDWCGGTDFETGQVIAAATPQLYEATVRIMRAANGGAEALR